MATQGDDVPQLRDAFRSALADSGWTSPDTLLLATDLAIDLWEHGHHGEAESLLLEALQRVNEEAFGQSPRGRAALEDLAFTLGYIGATRQADSLYARVIELSTNAGDRIDSFWWSKWAHVKAKLAHWDDAISLHRKALEAAVRFDGPESSVASVEYFFLAEALRESGAADEAVVISEAGLEVADKTQAHMIRILSQARIAALQDLGDRDTVAEAVRDFRAAAANWSPELQERVNKWLSDLGLDPDSE